MTGAQLTTLPPGQPTVVDLLDAAAHGRGYLRFEPGGSERSVADLWRDGAQVARWLTARVGRGARVGAFLSNTPDCPATIFGIWRSDNTLVSLPYPSRGADLNSWVGQMQQMCELADVGLLLVDEAFRGLLPPLPIDVASFQEAAGGGPACDVDGVGGLIQFTSGSLGSPKGVVLSPQALAANILAIIEALGVGQGDSAASWLPLSHDMGFVGMFLTTVASTAPAIGASHLVLQTPESFLADPASWLRNCQRGAVTITTAPNFAFELATRSRRFLPGLDLSALRGCITGAERVHAPTVRAFVTAFADAGLREQAICPAYGMAEAALAVTMVRPEQTWAALDLDPAALSAGNARTWNPAGPGTPVTYVGNGRPVTGMDVRIASGAGEDVGEVHVKGTSLLSGYLGAGTPFTTDGWLATRDLGFVRDGELYVIGRADETIIVGGQNHYPADIESAVRHDAVRAGCLAAVPLAHGYALLAELRATGEPADSMRICRELAASAVRGAGVRPALVAILPRGRMLKTPSGKVQRTPLAAAIARDELETLASLWLEGAHR